MLVYIFWRSTINHGLPFGNSKKYDISLYLFDMMVDRVDRVDRWRTWIPDVAMLENYYYLGQWLLFGKEIHFVTKYRIQGHVICELSRLCYWNTRVNFHVIWSVATLWLQNRNKVVRQPKRKHKFILVLSKKKSPQQLLFSATFPSCKWQEIKEEPFPRTYQKKQQKAISLI